MYERNGRIGGFVERKTEKLRTTESVVECTESESQSGVELKINEEKRDQFTGNGA